MRSMLTSAGNAGFMEKRFMNGSVQYAGFACNAQTSTLLSSKFLDRAQDKIFVATRRLSI